MKLCSCCCFPHAGPQRFVVGTVWLIFGSIGLLIAQQVYDESDGDGGDETTEEDETMNDQATATTAVILCVLVLVFSLVALVFHVLCIRKVKQLKQQNDAEQQAATNDDDDNEQQPQQQQSFLEWFLYPENETVPAARANKQKKKNAKSFVDLSWNSSRSVILLLAPSLALFLLLVVRLFVGANNFQGVPYYLDFGWKYGLLPHERSIESDGDELYNEPAEKSTSYRVEFNSYGHAMQGFFSCLLAFPVIMNGLVCCTKKKNCVTRIWNALVYITPYALTIYPTYNIIKRVNKAADAFAGSSFANNAFEWSSGFVLACAVGNLVTSIALWRRMNQKPKDDDDDDDEDEEDRSYAEETDQQQQQDTPWWKFWKADGDDDAKRNNNNKQQVGFCVVILQTILGVLLVITVFAAAVLFGLTWHGCLEGSPDECVNYSENGSHASPGVFAGFCLIPGIIILGAVLMECRRRQQQK